jgi:hypothetical protein
MLNNFILYKRIPIAIGDTEDELCSDAWLKIFLFNFQF